jgi:putative intracellular protease/amidase
VPFLLQTRLESLGARVETAPNFQSFAIADGRLVTGQNPASARKAADLTLMAIAVVRERF